MLCWRSCRCVGVCVCLTGSFTSGTADVTFRRQGKEAYGALGRKKNVMTMEVFTSLLKYGVYDATQETDVMQEHFQD